MGSSQALWAAARHCGQQSGIVGSSQVLWAAARHCGQQSGIVGSSQALWAAARHCGQQPQLYDITFSSGILWTVIYDGQYWDILESNIC